MNQLKSQFAPIPLQQQALDLAQSSPATFLLYYGGGRSGKSIVISYMILLRAMTYPGSRHGIFRRHAVDCRSTLFKLAFPKACELAFPGFLQNEKNCTIIKDEMTIELANGSIISFNGFDENNRERILGDEFDTIWLNECSQFAYDDFETLGTRLSGQATNAAGKIIKPRMFLDLNPDLDTHFTYKIWYAGLDPARNLPLQEPEDYAALQMNLAEDATHINAGYLTRQKRASDEKVQRYVTGFWRSERQHSLFKLSNINKNRVLDAPSLTRIVVAVDPAASSHEGSDETGIVVAGEGADGHYYVLDDRSLKGTPSEWAKAAVQAYRDWNADLIVAEKNMGGDMVSHTLQSVGHNHPVKLVHAARGKVLRAEPISALYADDRIHHLGEHAILERQMAAFHSSFDRKKGGSPDRLDAMVWAITELSERPVERGGGSVKLGGFW